MESRQIPGQATPGYREGRPKSSGRRSLVRGYSRECQSCNASDQSIWPDTDIGEQLVKIPRLFGPSSTSTITSAFSLMISALTSSRPDCC